jgi:hypothetical protein
MESNDSLAGLVFQSYDQQNHRVSETELKTLRTKKPPRIRAIPFGEQDGKKPYNASAIIALADSTFLFCDNNNGDALFELRLLPDGQMAGPLARRPIHGLESCAVDDLEGMTCIQTKSGNVLVAVSSLCLKKRKGQHKKRSKRGKPSPDRNGLLRITIEADQRLVGEVIPDFRDWLVEHSPELGKASRYLPDDGGLNVEGLGWSSTDSALLLGVRSPVIDGRPVILRVRFKQVNGPWDVGNFEMLPPVFLDINQDEEEQGIRTIGLDSARKQWLIVVGNSTSKSKAPFHLYRWDGNSEGYVQLATGVRFHKRMKVEGVTLGTIQGRAALVFVDDAGGYQVLWDDDERLV